MRPASKASLLAAVAAVAAIGYGVFVQAPAGPRTLRDFEPDRVAELDWWAARRDPARSSPEQVGRLIAEEYALLYGAPLERVAEAGLLRAQAAALRDHGGGRADWPRVEDLLRQSFRSLHAGVADRTRARD